MARTAPKMRPTSGMAERCRCSQPADYRCTSRHLEEGRWEERKGQKVWVQPYITFYRCSECVKGEVASDDPPRYIEALPHHSAVLKRERDDAAKALMGNVEAVRLGDWGKATA